jgi:hypothetical protein
LNNIAIYIASRDAGVSTYWYISVLLVVVLEGWGIKTFKHHSKEQTTILYLANVR